MMFRATTNSTREWVAAHARELTACGLIDLIRRRCAQQLAVADRDSRLTLMPRRELLALWAEVEGARDGSEGASAERHENSGP